MLKNIIKQNLIEIKENKEKILLSEQKIDKKLTLIFEHFNHISELTETEKNKLGASFIYEIHHLYQDELILENDALANFISDKFAKLGMSSIETVIESVVNFLLTKMGMGDGFLKDVIVSIIATDPRRFVKSLKSCKEFSSLITESLLEAMIKNLQQKFNATGWGWDILRNWLGEVLKEQSTISILKDKMNSGICSIFSQVVSGVKGVFT